MSEYGWQAIAVRYGTMESTRAHQFYRYEAFGEPDGPITLDYYFWVLRNKNETILVDSGFHPDAIRNRPGRICLIPPTEALSVVGVEPDQVSRIIVTHCHYDHIGNLASFPEATFVVQKTELDFWRGPFGRVPAVASSVEQQEIELLAASAETGRAQVLEGNTELAPGLTATLVGGHCPGQQIVRVDGDPPLILCSDAVHFTEEVDRFMPFAVFFDMQRMLETYDLLRQAAKEGATFVAGHDPRVMTQFPEVAGAEGIAVRLS